MKSNYKRIGDFIERTNTRNKDGVYEELLGININKYFMPSVANVVGTDLTKYKIVEPKMFACNRMHVGRDMRLPIAFSDRSRPFLVSPAYDVFEITKPQELLHEYLMMWFTRAEFDRNTWFYTDTDVRGKLGWDSFCDMTLPVPSIEKQQEIVDDYNTVQDRIRINEELNTALEETAQALYKHWFVDFEFPTNVSSTSDVSSSGVENDLGAKKPLQTLGYKSSGGAMVYNEELDMEIPVGWEVVELGEVLQLQRGFDLPHRLRKEGQVPVFASTGINSFHQEGKVMPPGIVTGRSGSIGSIFYINEEFWPLNTTLWVKECKRCTMEFAFYLLKNFQLENFATGSAVPTLNRNHVHESFICLPPDSLQNEFSEIFITQNNLIIKGNEMADVLKKMSSMLLSKMATVMDGKELAN